MFHPRQLQYFDVYSCFFIAFSMEFYTLENHYFTSKIPWIFEVQLSDIKASNLTGAS